MSEKYVAAAGRYSEEEKLYRRCGKSGLKLPKVSLGLWHNFGTEADMDVMKSMLFTAFDHGITHFDLANNYGPEPGAAEENFGKIMSADLRPYRDEMIISSKAGFTMWDGPYGDWGSRKYLMASLDQSLKRMQLDYVDIFYHHRMDPETPLEETIMALDQIVRSGKALYVGISNYDGPHAAEARKLAREIHLPLIINQNRYSILDRTIEKNGLKDFAREDGMGVICFSPLAQGMLSEKYLNGIPSDSRIAKDGRFLHADDLKPEKMEGIRRLDEIAKEDGQKVETTGFISIEGPQVDGFMTRTSLLFPGAENLDETLAELDSSSEDLRYGVIASDRTVWLVEKDEVSPAHVPTFEEAKDAIRPRALRDARAEAFKASVEALAAKGTNELFAAAKEVTTNLTFSVTDLRQGEFDDQHSVVRAAMKTVKGELSEFTPTSPSRGIVVYCVDRVPGDAAKAMLVKSQVRGEVSWLQLRQVPDAWKKWNLERMGFQPGERTSVERAEIEE